MKIVLVFSVVVAVAAVNAKADKNMEECTEETGLTEPEVTKYLLEDDGENDAKATKFLMCIVKKNGGLDDEGHIVVDRVRSAVKTYMEEIDAGDDKEALDCVQEKDTAEETVLALGKCLEKRRAELSTSK